MTVCIVRVVFADTVWLGVQKDGPSEYTAQRFSPAGGSSTLVIGHNFGTYGRHYNVAISGGTLYSGNGYNVYKWDAESGAYVGQQTLTPALSSHLDDQLYGIGVAANGDLLFASFGYSTEQRRVARYTAAGTWVADYAATRLMHVQGTPAASDLAVFVASRYNLGTWTEMILMFAANGTYLREFGTELGGTVGDVAVMSTNLYALDYNDGIRVYALNGTNAPAYVGLIPFPSGIDPSDTRTDELVAHGGCLYVGDGPDNAWYKISLAGTLLATYSGETRGTCNWLGSFAVYTSAGDTTSPTVSGCSPVGREGSQRTK